MSDENLRRLLGDDYDQMSPDELKDRLGKRTPDFNPTKVISPASNENYKKAVDNNAGEYYNSRVDDLYKAYLKDRYPNTTPQDIANRMSQKAGITPPQINHILPDKNGNITMPDGAVHKAYGAYDDGDNTINLRSNGKFNKNDEMSTVAHEMRHAINFKGNSDPILDIINKATIPGSSNITSPSKVSEEFVSGDPGEVEKNILDGNFRKVSDAYNRGHFFGNDQVEDVQQDLYNPNVYTKLKNIMNNK